MLTRSFAAMLLFASALFSLEDTANAEFFRKLERELRLDYLACTGDSSPRPVMELIRWKRWTDSMTALPDFSEAQKAYRVHTGNSPVSARPCMVLNWKLSRDSAAAFAARENAIIQEKEREAAAESLAVATEMAALRDRPDFLGGIPLGISRRAFFWRAARSDFGTFIDRGSYLICTSVPLGGRSWLGAFYFDTLGLCRIELEGTPRAADSLDEWVRNEALLLSGRFERLIGTPPHRINRVSRDEIAAGALSIVHAWSQSRWSVAVGLSRVGYRYYAKAVVTNRPLPRVLH